MKRILAIGSIVALAVLGFAAPASAAPADASLLRPVSTRPSTREDALGLANVGEAVKALGGQGKNETARALRRLSARHLSALVVGGSERSVPSRRLVFPRCAVR